MRVWRIVRRHHLDEVWAGTGGLHASGRWHEKGTRVVYTAEHPAVCAMEVLVHLDRQLVPTDLLLCEAAIPDSSFSTLSADALSDDWAAWPPGQETRTLGMRWLAEAQHLALRVPSAAAPRSFNILLNPAHRDARLIRPISAEPWLPDGRLLGHIA